MMCAMYQEKQGIVLELPLSNGSFTKIILFFSPQFHMDCIGSGPLRLLDCEELYS